MKITSLTLNNRTSYYIEIDRSTASSVILSIHDKLKENFEKRELSIAKFYRPFTVRQGSSIIPFEVKQTESDEEIENLKSSILQMVKNVITDQTLQPKYYRTTQSNDQRTPRSGQKNIRTRHCDSTHSTSSEEPDTPPQNRSTAKRDLGKSAGGNSRDSLGFPK